MSRARIVWVVLLVLAAASHAADPGGKKRRPLPHECGRVVLNHASEKAGLPPVVFDHWRHRAKFTCRLCHVDVGSAMAPGATGITAADNAAGAARAMPVPAYVLGLALLLGVAAFGEVVNGARRWINLGFGRFQPSEMMKIAMPLMLAWYFHRKEGSIRLRDFAVAAALLVVPVALVARQPDLGTALLVAAAGFYVIFLPG